MDTVYQATKELVIDRVFNAPRELVWKAWTDPKLMMRWWGPREYSAPVIKIDLRVGGVYIGSMRGPDGKIIWSTGVYREISPFERLIMTDSFANERGNVVPATYYGMGADFPLELLVTLTFEEQGGKTKMTLHHAGLPAGKMLDDTRQGWGESFDKLDEVLKKYVENKEGDDIFSLEPVGKEIIIKEVFNAPRERIFNAFLDAKLIPEWWGPRGYTTSVDKLEAKPGGAWRFVQCGPDGVEYAFHGEFREIEKPDCLVYTFEYESMPGHETIDSISIEEKEGKTILTERIEFQSVEDRDGMLKMGMEMGSRESAIRLSELLMEK